MGFALLLSNAPCGTRWCHVQRLARDLPVAVGVQEDPVLCGVPAPIRTPDHVMVVPSCESSDFLVTQRTETVLLFPQVQELPSALEGVCHLHAEAFCEGHFPWRVIRVRGPLDLDMPLHGHVPCTTECEFVGLPLLTRVCPHEGPWSSMARAKVFLRYPSARLLRVPPWAHDHRLLKMAVSTFMKWACSPRGGESWPTRASPG